MCEAKREAEESAVGSDREDEKCARGLYEVSSVVKVQNDIFGRRDCIL